MGSRKKCIFLITLELDETIFQKKTVEVCGLSTVDVPVNISVKFICSKLTDFRHFQNKNNAEFAKIGPKNLRNFTKMLISPKVPNIADYFWRKTFSDICPL